MKKLRVEIEYKVGSRKVIAYAYDKQGFYGKGVATCSPEDLFDLNIGASLAIARAKVKLEQNKIKFYLRRKEEAWREFAEYTQLINQCANRATPIIEDLEADGHHS